MFWRQVKSTKKALKKLPVSAKVVLVSKDGKVLLLRKSSGVTDLPGGKVEEGEDIYEALEREIFEEIQIEVQKFKFVSSWVKHSTSLGDRLVLVFEARVKKKADQIEIRLSEEHNWSGFLSKKDLEKIDDLHPGYANALLISLSRHAKN